MSFYLLVSAVTALSTTLALNPKLTTNPILDSKDIFQVWKTEFNIKYNSVAEETNRFSAWKKTVSSINLHNSKAHQSWKKGVNAFSAYTFEQFNDEILMDPQDCSATEHRNIKLKKRSRVEQPSEIDWRDEKIISEVKNQGTCGSCWTFSTTGCLEAHVAIATKQLTLFSEENLVDCAFKYNNFGCNGGLPSQAFEYIRYNGGIDSEFNYPYTAGKTKTNGTCKYSDANGISAGKVYEVYNVSEYDESDLYVQVGTVGPVSICFDVVSGFESYASGVYESSLCGNTSQSVNHAVLAVGYGVAVEDVNGISTSTPYWLVKNSWGWQWGINGYFKIVRGENMCGLASCASYPIVDADLLV